MLAEARTTGVWSRISRRATARAAPGPIGPEVWLVATLTAVGAVLRFATITSQSFWVDEATTYHEVGLSFGQMLHALRLNETTPPLYFAVAWVWTRVFGAGELGLRSLSAVCGIVVIPVVYLCGRELVSRAAGVVAAALAAFSPFMIWYSQEARSYMLLALLCGLSFLFCARAARTRTTRDVALWGAASALAVLTHFFAGFLVAPEALWLLWLLRNRAAVVTCVVVAAAQLAVLPLAIGDTSHPLNWIMGFRLADRVNDIPVDFAVSQLYQTASAVQLDQYALPGALALAGVAALLLWGWGGERERHGALLSAGLAVCVLAVPLLLAWLGPDYVYNRNFMPAWIPLAVALGAACTVPRARVAGGLLAAVLIGTFVWAGVTLAGDQHAQRTDWRGAAAALGHRAGARAIVAFDGNDAEQPLSVYLPGTTFSYTGAPTSTPAVSVGELDVVGDPSMAVAQLPPGVTLIGSRPVSYNVAVWRFALDPAWTASTDVIASRAYALLGQTIEPTATPSVLIQR
jgi:4-amino-4-deoxy-L-arabinose transferase-like glycosyltransferase